MPIRPEKRDRYPTNWPEIRAEILDRAEARCECFAECGSTHHPMGRCVAADRQPSPYTGSRVVLTIAHLNHTPEDCREENLRAYCQLCHLAYDTDHHRQTAAATHRAAIEAAGQLALDTA